MRIGTPLLIAFSGFVMTIAASTYENYTMAAVIVAAHVIIYFLHVIEVKINRILDDRRLVITQEDINRRG